MNACGLFFGVFLVFVSSQGGRVHCILFRPEALLLSWSVTHKSTVARTVMCRQDGRGRFLVLLDDLSKCRTN